MMNIKDFEYMWTPKRKQCIYDKNALSVHPTYRFFVCLGLKSPLPVSEGTNEQYPKTFILLHLPFIHII